MLHKESEEGRQLSTTRRVKHVPFLNLFSTWGPVVAVMALIYSLSSRPEFGQSGLLVGFLANHLAGTPLYPTLVPIAATLDAYAALCGHLAEFAILAVAVKLALDRQWPWMHHLLLAFLIAWVFTVLYGALDEWHQSFVVGRHSDPMDVLVDSLGAAGALAILYVLARNRSRRKRRPRV